MAKRSAIAKSILSRSRPDDGEISEAEILARMIQCHPNGSAALLQKHCLRLTRQLEGVRCRHTGIPSRIHFPFLEDLDLNYPAGQSGAGNLFLKNLQMRIQTLFEERSILKRLNRQNSEVFSLASFEFQDELTALYRLYRFIRSQKSVWDQVTPKGTKVWWKLADFYARSSSATWAMGGMTIKSLDQAGPTVSFVKWALERTIGHSATEKSIQSTIENYRRR